MACEQVDHDQDTYLRPRREEKKRPKYKLTGFPLYHPVSGDYNPSGANRDDLCAGMKTISLPHFNIRRVDKEKSISLEEAKTGLESD